MFYLYKMDAHEMISIVFIDTIGIVYDGNTLNHRGLGGSESAVILMSRELAKLGFNVTVYNDCNDPMVNSSPGVYDGVEYRPFNRYEGETYDIVISLRTVIPFAPENIFQNFQNIPYKYDFAERIRSKAKLKAIWMHDTFCTGDHFLEELVVSGYIDEIFTLSDFHTSYVTNCNHGKKRMFEVLKRNIFETRNGMTLYKDWVDITQKDKNLFVFNAAYNKGLEPLITKIWPEVHKHIPEAKLTVIGGYYKFREAPPPDHTAENWTALVDQQTNDWHKLKDEYEGKDIGITFTGIITQKQVADILEKASFFVYPTAFPETFGISMMESMAYNTPLITCRFGAMEETVPELASYKIDYPIAPNGLFPHIHPDFQANLFVNTIVKAYRDPYLHQQKMYYCNIIKEICTWESVAVQWKQHFYNRLKEYLPIEDYRRAQKINLRVNEIYNRKFITQETNTVYKTKENRIVCIVPFYNCERYIERCIASIAAQDYDNYFVYLIDDFSTDAGATVALKTAQACDGTKFHLFQNRENMGAVYNQINTIKSYCDNKDIVLLIDGDDALVNNPNVFNIINNKYNEGAEFTYGSCWSEVDNIPLISQPYPPEIKKQKKYREHHFTWKLPYTHLRSFRKYLLNNISDSDFQDEQKNWFRAGGDNSTFYNIIEQADPDKVVCIPDVLYLYNDKNPLNDYKVNPETQNETRDIIMNKKKVLIAIPTARYIEPETFKCIYDQIIPEGVEVDFQFFYGYRVDQVRNLISDWVVKEYDYLFAVDHDITFGSNTLSKMLSADKDLVSGIYVQRNHKHKILEVYNENGRMSVEFFRNIPDNSLFPITACGFGCVLVKKEVFVKIGHPQFEYHVALDHKNTVSEDHDFCAKAIACGFKLYADSSIKCGHIGSIKHEV